eukprot:746522-Hanusia_phi.AAC.12
MRRRSLPPVQECSTHPFGLACPGTMVHGNTQPPRSGPGAGSTQTETAAVTASGRTLGAT